MATNYDQEILGAEQQRMTSEALRRAAGKPLDGQMVSGWYVPPSWTQYAAKGLESYLAGKDARDAKTQGDTLRAEKQKAIAEMLKSYPTERSGQAYNSTENFDKQQLAAALTGKEQTQSPAPQAGGNVNIKPTNQDYMKWAIDANQVDPSTAQMGLKMFEADASRKAAESKAQEDRTFRELMMGKQFTQQKELAQMKPQGLVQVDVNGNPVYMRQAEAAGQQAFQKPVGVGSQANTAIQHVKDATESNALLDQVEKIGPTATGSGAGAMRDVLGRMVGVSTEGSQAASQLAVLGASLTAKVPKMSGPQSDKDVAMYKAAAGNIADPNIPWPNKQAAIRTIREINNRQLSYGNDISAPAAQTAASPAQLGGAKFLGFE